jgi:hypothetical protein
LASPTLRLGLEGCTLTSKPGLAVNIPATLSASN